MYRLIAILTVTVALLTLNARSSYCSWAYRTLSELLEESEAVIVGRVFEIEKKRENKYANVQVAIVLKGKIVRGSVIQLPFHEKQEGPNGYPITYEIDKRFILLLKGTEDGYDLYRYPQDTKIAVSDADVLLILEIRKLIEIGTIEDEKVEISMLTELLKSPIPAIRESAVYSLGKFDCKEAFDGLVEALRDEDRQVRSKAAQCLWSLEKKRPK